jgi:hypothetical protein
MSDCARQSQTAPGLANSAPIEHKPWKGSLYCKLGIDGQRLAIVGYSHHGDDDNEDYTIKSIRNAILGNPDGAFFNLIRNYFFFESSDEFWERVMFLNYLPRSVGCDDKRYATGTDEQIQQAKCRFLRVIEQYRPQKVLILSKKTWWTLPMTVEETAGRKLKTLGPEFPDFEWGTYRTANNHVVMAFGLRHPQGANGELMRKAIQRILAMPPVP